MTPARYISPITSMIPEPHTPLIVRSSVAAANPGSSLHRSQPMTLKRGASVVAVDADALDGTGRGALAARDLCTFERRAGRARCGELLLGAAEHDLGVGADVDQQLPFLAAVRAFGQHCRGGVGADVAGDARTDEGPCCGEPQGRGRAQSCGSLRRWPA